MARIDFLKLIIHQAARNGFDFEHWCRSWLGHEWTTEEAALQSLARNHLYYCLLFSHDFARSFWKQGTRITFMVPASSYTRLDKNGSLVEVKRKAYTRRRLKPDAWKYHLREMAATEEPLRYIRRYVLIVQEPEPAARRPTKSLSR
jgi:hypothetical protein